MLQTPRLILQTPRPRDVRALYRWTRDAAVHRYLAFEGPRGPKDTLEFVRRARREQRSGVTLVYVLHDRDTREVLGCCGAHNIDGARAAKGEIGFWLAPPRWGGGVMREALEVFIPHLLGGLGLRRLSAQVVTQNERSERLLRGLGFRHEGTLRRNLRKRTHIYDVHAFELLRTDTAARRLLRRAR